MSRKLVVAALAAVCLIAFGAPSQAVSSVKSSKSNIGEKAKGGAQGQSAKPTLNGNNGSSARGRADCEF